MAAAAFSAERDRGGSCVPQTMRALGVTAGMEDIQIMARWRRRFRPSGIMNVVVGQGSRGNCGVVFYGFSFLREGGRGQLISP
jgi:hypothetical protein